MSNDPQYPDGKLREDDDGAIQVGVGVLNGAVVVEFANPVKWIGWPPEQARKFANAIIKHADSIEKPTEH
jgi:hypothetical protein